ncbi:MAG TPA: bacteriohemerythrin [Candidatus Sulfotelmatobacter sp.]|nr:bacteriohemerythrin [Candidatus Sulfotelmatobacter sp.]
MSDTKCVFRWTDIYKVNVAILDQQHQALFDTVNELERALRVGEGNAVIDGILDRLMTYAGLHFAAEESLMERHNFPGLSTHQIQHEMFRKKMTTLLERQRSAKAGVAVELLLFLQSWLKKHVLRTDKQYSAFLNARGVQ